MQREDFTLKTADNIQLKATVHRADISKAVVVWLHGFAEHRARYADFARYLTEQGYTFAAIDLRGHGESDGKRGMVNKFTDYFYDTDALLGWARDNYADSKLVIGSHSMGGLIAARYLERGELPRAVDAALFSSPFLGIGNPVPAWKEGIGKVMSGLIPSLGVPSGLDAALLSNDPAQVEAYRNDPLVFKNARARWFTEVTEHQKHVVEEAGKIHLPVLVCQGLGDQIVDPDVSKAFYENTGSSDKKWIGYDGFYHEILNELENKKVYSDMGGWLNERF